MHITVVEDERKLADVLKQGLEQEGYPTEVFYSAEHAKENISNKHDVTSLMVLDLMLPDQNGFDFCQELRQQRFDAPILVLTARDTVEDKVRALDCGADDYLTKPFAFEELLARIRALLRRPQTNLPERLTAADLVLDIGLREAFRGTRAIPLTTREFDLLSYLLTHPHAVVGRQELQQHVWGSDDPLVSNVMDVHMRNLRKKIDDGYEKKLIRTVRGVGYALEA